jgi:hypothetical protein
MLEKQPRALLLKRHNRHSGGPQFLVFEPKFSQSYATEYLTPGTARAKSSISSREIWRPLPGFEPTAQGLGTPSGMFS